MLMEEVNSAHCRMWHLHSRLGDEITEKSCEPLIQSIRVNGLKHAVLGRRIDEPGFSIELIYGARRLFAAQHLGITIPVKLCELDDREALVEMDIENRVRRDITPYERGLNYRRWLAAGFFPNQVELAKKLGVSEAQVSRVLKFADLPAAVVGAFECPSQIREEWAIELARQCEDPATRAQVLRRSRERARDGASGRPQAIYAALIAQGSKKRPPSDEHDEVIRDSDGKPLLRVGYRSKTVHLIIRREILSEEQLRDIATQLQKILGTRRGTQERARRVVEPSVVAVGVRARPHSIAATNASRDVVAVPLNTRTRVSALLPQTLAASASPFVSNRQLAGQL
jgi:ParB/RepB/Spo0J family partition protein